MSIQRLRKYPVVNMRKGKPYTDKSTKRTVLMRPAGSGPLPVVTVESSSGDGYRLLLLLNHEDRELPRRREKGVKGGSASPFGDKSPFGEVPAVPRPSSSSSSICSCITVRNGQVCKNDVLLYTVFTYG
jgi:hypothetical protein